MKLSKKNEAKLVETLNARYGMHNWTVEQKVDTIIELFSNSDNVTITQARSDLKYLRDNYGSPCDFCGSFCNNEMLDDILMGTKSIKEVIIANIKYYFSNGLETYDSGCSSSLLPDLNDSRVQRIMERYFIFVK